MEKEKTEDQNNSEIQETLEKKEVQQTEAQTTGDNIEEKTPEEKIAELEEKIEIGRAHV